jgi:cytochrome c oxidase assembly protein Cox11
MKKQEEQLKVTFEAEMKNGRTYVFIPTDRYMVLTEDSRNIIVVSYDLGLAPTPTLKDK